MTTNASAFPFFAQTERRSLTLEERAILEHLLHNQDSQYAAQLDGLVVVGRCGCNACPTVFFQPHASGEQEDDLVSMVGKDATDGVVGAVLLAKQGVLSQLEFYSVDGHEPWEVPSAKSLVPL